MPFLDVLYLELNDAWFYKGGKCGCFVLINDIIEYDTLRAIRLYVQSRSDKYYSYLHVSSTYFETFVNKLMWVPLLTYFNY